MKEMSLKDVQDVSLEILAFIDKFCMENNINYSLGYGSLIGAVRHGGFIPWDDDLDIIMPRPDYNKFCQLFRDSKYKLYAPELGNNTYVISRVCEMEKTRVFKWYAWTEEPTGIWVDIFPIDAYPDNDLPDLIRKDEWQLLMKCIGNALSFHLDFKQLIKNLIFRFTYRNIDQDTTRYNYLNHVSRLDYDNSRKVCNYGSPYRLRDIHPKEIFENYIRVPFCSMEVSIITNCDKYLKNIYGDYMTLPPAEKQTRGHVRHKYFWR